MVLIFLSSMNLILQIENEWLNSIDEFENQYNNSKSVTVWEYMHKPGFKTKDRT